MSHQDILTIIIGCNILVFFLMWKDKRAAINGDWRVPENVLLLLTLLGGTPAMMFARKFFRHKTIKGSFVLRLYAIILLQVGFLFYTGLVDFS